MKNVGVLKVAEIRPEEKYIFEPQKHTKAHKKISSHRSRTALNGLNPD
jgi:hypothetical protein